MEYVEGVDLAMVLRTYGALPVDAALEVAAEVAGALDAASREDENGRPVELIQPSNILITTQGEVKVLDFGVAPALAERESVTRVRHDGSAGYLAPERLDAIDPARSDIYSLGLVLFELLTGEHFGEACSHPEQQRARIEQRLQGVNGGPGVADLLARLLASTPEERPRPREVHRACLAARIGSAGLPAWSEARVPGLIEQRRATLRAEGTWPRGEQVPEPGGTTDGFAAGTLPMPMDPVLPRFDDRTRLHRQRDERRTVAVAAAGVVFLLLGTVLWWLQPVTDELPDGVAVLDPAVEPVPVEVTVPEPEGVPVPEPVEAPVSEPVEAPVSEAEEAPLSEAEEAPVPESVEAPDPEPVPEPVEAPAPPPAPTPLPSPRPRPDPAPAPVAPAAAPRSGATVSLTGDAANVTLVKGSQRFRLPQWVPQGSYQIQASFQGEEAVPIGEVSIPASGKMTIACNALFVGCEAR